MWSKSWCSGPQKHSKRHYIIQTLFAEAALSRTGERNLCLLKSYFNLSLFCRTPTHCSWYISLFLHVVFVGGTLVWRQCLPRRHPCEFTIFKNPLPDKCIPHRHCPLYMGHDWTTWTTGREMCKQRKMYNMLEKKASPPSCVGLSVISSIFFSYFLTDMKILCSGGADPSRSR